MLDRFEKKIPPRLSRHVNAGKVRRESAKVSSRQRVSYPPNPRSPIICPQPLHPSTGYSRTGVASISPNNPRLGTHRARKHINPLRGIADPNGYPIHSSQNPIGIQSSVVAMKIDGTHGLQVPS